MTQQQDTYPASGGRRRIAPFVFAVVLIGFIYLAREVVVLVVFSVLLAYVLTPLADGLERILKPIGAGRGVRRAVSLIVVLAIILLIFIALYLTLPTLARQLQSLGQNVPKYLERVRVIVERSARASEEGSLTSLWWNSLEEQLGVILGS